MNLKDFIAFDPMSDCGNIIPKTPGNYLVTIRDISALPTSGHKVITQQFRGHELIYTGITKRDLNHRIWKSHISSHAGRSTLRLTLGCLLGYTLIPRDKNSPNNGKVRFNADDERELRDWMKKNLLFYFLPNDNPKEFESELIKQFNPPLNLSENESPINREFREDLSFQRSQRPWQI